MFEPHRIKKFIALHDWVVVSDMNFDSRVTSSGIILHSDNAKSEGIRPRWAKVYAVGPDQHSVKPGEWICVSHGRWTRGVTIEDDSGKHTIRRVDIDEILLVSDSLPIDDTLSDAITVPQRSRY